MSSALRVRKDGAIGRLKLGVARHIRGKILTSRNLYQNTSNFVPTLTTNVATLIDPKADDQILDLGCGDDVLSSRLASMVAPRPRGRSQHISRYDHGRRSQIRRP
jgi:hypothetical protein